jgi:phosphate acyltransferase
LAKYDIAVDMMSGDCGLDVSVPAVLSVLESTDLILALVGDKALLEPHLTGIYASYAGRITLCHADQVVGMDERPTSALRAKKTSSMRIALELVKSSDAKACVSAGNTGALMAMAYHTLKMLPGIERPAIMAAFPANHPAEEVFMLDLGANVENTPQQLYQFAVMGSLAVDLIKHKKSTRVGLLNVGSEAIKGNETVKAADRLMRNQSMFNYRGYIEGDRIFSGEVDLIVCDGFVGNVVLKTLEGAMQKVFLEIKQSCLRSIWSRCMVPFVRFALGGLKKKLSPSQYNGAFFLGLRGVVVKSHGGASAQAFARAIIRANQAAEFNLNDLEQSLNAFFKQGA